MLDQDVIISDSELPRFESEALSGSGEAAYRLFRYYNSIKLDFKEGLYWVTISAENGYPKGVYGLGLMLAIRRDPDARIRKRDLERAKFWLKRAAEEGNDLAVGVLREIGQGKYD